MKIVHLADLHLGYRAYHRTRALGINVREADVAKAFREALQRVLEIGPDLVLVAGDVFHTVRPSNSAIADAFRQFAHFCAESDGARVIIIAGNHDSPRAAETGSILRLFDEIPGVHVVHHGAKRLVFPELDAAILCLPHSELIASESATAIEPAPHVAHNILLAHAAIDDERLKLLMDFGAARLKRGAIEPEQWSYVGLGHYHLRSRLAPNMFYAGGIERTSLNIWAEADALPAQEPELRRWAGDTWPEAAWGKGFIEYDLEDDSVAFHTLASPRPVIDLTPIIRDQEEAEELDSAIESSLAKIPDGIDGKIIRLRIFELPRDIYRELDHKKIREYRTRALHFHLDTKPPKAVRHEGSAAPGRRFTLEEELAAFLKGRWTPSSKSVDMEELVQLGVRYLREAEDTHALENA
ncbi:MAG: DNA repair exonuclease [Gemmatimonadota bacterium]|nr:DNA repair exonuclease [Candidatus Palauibacterales bacterium]